MFLARASVLLFSFFYVGLGLAKGQTPAQNNPAPSTDTMAQLLEQLRAQDARLKELENEVARLKAAQPAKPEAAAPANGAEAATPAPPAESAPSTAPEIPAAPPVQTESDAGGHEHGISIGRGPALNIRGFFDFNFGTGSIANPLVFPIIDGGCGTCGNAPTPPHSTFQAGEFDLLLTSKLSGHLTFLAEAVLGPDVTNEFGPDLERYSLTYRANRYFAASAGRFHTSIGYYNTAYHHGNWFSTAEGRPIMYLFEDSGGILPVHMVGLDFSGAVPHTESVGLHWVAEVGNGLGSNSNVGEAVQNFYSDRNAKAVNLAAYIRPPLIQGLQIGGSWYRDALYPTGVPRVTQNIESAYVVYLTSNWEFLNEAVLLSNQVTGLPNAFRSPMAYTQAARKFGIYKPYFRYQYVRDHPDDPVNLLKGTFYGPSAGLRVDFSDYAAFKLQFNHLYESNHAAGNGFDTQLAFTF